MFTTVSIVEAPHLGQRHLNQNYRNYNHKVMLLLHDFKPLQCSQYFYYQNGSNDYSHVKRLRFVVAISFSYTVLDSF